MLSYASNGVRTIIVETANRFARDLIVQETGFAMLKERGVDLIAADKPDAFLDDTPTANLIRQVLGAVSEFEKAMVVSKLKGARERKRAALARAAKDDRTIRVKVEGRKSYAERDPDLVRVAKRLHRYPVNGKRRSLRCQAPSPRPGSSPAPASPLGQPLSPAWCGARCLSEDRGRQWRVDRSAIPARNPTTARRLS